MTRRSLAAVVLGTAILVALLYLARPVAAGKPLALWLDFQGGVTNQYNPVEQQSSGWQGGPFCDIPRDAIVCNRTVDPLRPGACMWDVDDHTGIQFHGDYLRPGATAGLTKCFIGDTGWVFGIEQADKGLTLGLSIDGIFAIETTGNRMCVGGPSYRTDSPWMEPIPDSDGGVGVPGTFTWYVRNDTDRTIRFGRVAGVVAGSGNLGMSTYDNRWCPSGFPLVNTGEGSFDASGRGVWWSK